MKRIYCVGAVWLLLVVARPLAAADRYASPEGKESAAGIKEDPFALGRVLGGAAGVEPGDTVWLAAGTYAAPPDKNGVPYFWSQLSGTPEKPIVIRAAPGAHVTIDGGLLVRGADIWFWGIEVTDSRLKASARQAADVKKLPGAAVTVEAPRSRFINMHVHDGVQGFGFWRGAIDAEIYGCIIHDNGYNANDRGHGHAIYTQNNTGTKRIADNVIFRGFGYNLHGYGQKAGVTGYTIEGNISFSAGIRREVAMTPNYLLGSRLPIERAEVIDNVAYHFREIRDAAEFGYNVADADNGTLVLRGNYFGGGAGVEVNDWTAVEASGNTYVAAGSAKEAAVYCEGPGRDAQSISPDVGTRTQNHVIVRPNKYEQGRGHIAVFNWEGRDKVAVDLSSVVKLGAKFRVWNVQSDLYGEPTVAGTFNGGAVELPMLKSADAPEFDAFLIISE